jgi:3-keto-5-aminohexanoate cleavage enzyme
VQFVLGVPGGMSGTERNLRFLVEGMPEPVPWTVAGIGRFELPMAELSLRMGGHVRVGLEDNLYLSKGVLAKGNQELVAAAVRLVEASGRGLASSSDARCMLELA